MNKNPHSIWFLPSFLVLLFAPGIAGFFLYQHLKGIGWIDPLLIYANRKEFAAVTAGYAFTMLGFMAAIITILFSVVNSPNFKEFKDRGYLSVFFVGYFSCILTLMVTALLSVYGFSGGRHLWQHHALLISFVDSLWQVLMVTIIISNLARKSIH